MKFADFYPGQTIELDPYTITEEEIVEFATQWDPQWFHTDSDGARQSKFGGLIASGWHTGCIAMRMVVNGVLNGSESFASPGFESLRWPAPVRPGDTLHLRAEILDVRRSKSKPDIGVVLWRWRMHNQDDVEVLSLEATNFFDLATS
ncbi:MAG: MaoC family dehydratase [Pseudomonadota bacterium]